MVIKTSTDTFSGQEEVCHKVCPLDSGSQQPLFPRARLTSSLNRHGDKWVKGQGQEGKVYNLGQHTQAKNVPYSISNQEIKRNPLLLVIHKRLSQVRLACCNVFLTATVLHQYFQDSLT